MTAFAASFSTVASPKPGSSVAITSPAPRRVPLSIASSAARVGATRGKPSDHPRFRKSQFIASHATSRSAPS